MIKVFCVWETSDYGYSHGDRNLVSAFFDESKAVTLKNELEMDEHMKRNNNVHLGDRYWWHEYSVSTLEVE